MITKHTKPNAQNPQGGIVNQEGSDRAIQRYVRKRRQSYPCWLRSIDGKKVRVAKATGKVID